MLDNLKKYKVVLASNSPRRRELLAGLGVEFEVRTIPGIDESYPDSLDAADIPLYISCHKAEAYRSALQPDELLITADTIVWLDGEVLGKPSGREEAVAMLRKLSGAGHKVITGVVLTTSEWQKSFHLAESSLSLPPTLGTQPTQFTYVLVKGEKKLCQTSFLIHFS